MKLREILHQLEEVSKRIDVPIPKICGGTPRDKFMNRLENVSDIDLTNGTKTISYAAQEFAQQLKKEYNLTYKVAPDGHASIYLGNLKMDFSSNFIVPNIDQLLKAKNISNPTDLQKEMFSRDFTCNALLMDLNLKNIDDPTHQGFKDIKEKVIRTCLDPKITLTSNRNRVVRAIYLACKLDFTIDKSIIEFVKKSPESIKISTDKALKEKLDQAFTKDPEKAAHYLTEMNVWSQVPITEIMRPYYTKSRNKVAYFQGGGGVNEPEPHKKKYKSDKAIRIQPRFKEPLYYNYDYVEADGIDGKAKHGPGAGYTSLQDYDSIQEFLKARRKKLKDKYKADDSWIEDKKASIKLASDQNNIDFPVDNQIGNDFIIGDSTSYLMPNEIGSVPFSRDNAEMPGEIGSGTVESYPTAVPGLNFNYNALQDEDGKQESTLNFGNNIETRDLNRNEVDHDFLNKIINKYLNRDEIGLFGLPDGIVPNSDLDADQTISTENPDYGTTNSGNTTYEGTWI